VDCDFAVAGSALGSGLKTSPFQALLGMPSLVELDRSSAVTLAADLRAKLKTRFMVRTGDV
jgi:hypothetical protein